MRRAIFALALMALLPVSALASSVYLNGVLIDGVTGQKFEKVTSVRIDEKGNVHIDAPGYAAKLVNTPSSTPAASSTPAPGPAATPLSEPAETTPARITRRYWLATEQSDPGMTGYDIDLFINSRWVRKLRNGEQQVIMELTRYLVPGKNTILMMARKVATGSRRSESPQHVFKVIIGEGNEGGGNVMIDNSLIRFQRTAADAEDVSEEFTLTTR